MSEPRVGVLTFSITVSGGVGESPLQLANYLSNFSVKCANTNVFQYDFVDRDGFPVYGGDNNGNQGPVAGPINMKCYDFKLKLSSATDGVYDVRVFINN